MPRYSYIEPLFRLWYSHDCNWTRETSDMEEALSLAREKHPAAAISVHAECVINGEPAVAKVWIYAKETRGETEAEIYELIDRKIDHFIRYRTAGDTARGVNKPYRRV